MTTVSGYYIVKAPCCGAEYSKIAYGSINMMGWKRWSDGKEGGTLYDNDEAVCSCTCGRYFLTKSLERGELVRNRSWREGKSKPDNDQTRPDGLPYLYKHDAFNLIQNNSEMPGGEVEVHIRLLAWHALNDLDRKKEVDLATKLEMAFVAKIRRNLVNKTEPCMALSPDQVNELRGSNLEILIPLLKKFFPKNHLLIGDAQRALGDFQNAIDEYSKAVNESPKVVQHLINQAKAGNRKVIRIEPPEWFDDLVMPEPWVNTKAGNNAITLTSKDFWFKIFGMLNQVWALIEPIGDSDEVIVYWIDDNATIVDSEVFKFGNKAVAALVRDGYKLFEEEPDVWDVLCPPGGPYSKKINNNQ